MTLNEATIILLMKSMHGRSLKLTHKYSLKYITDWNIVFLDREGHARTKVMDSSHRAFKRKKNDFITLFSKDLRRLLN